MYTISTELPDDAGDIEALLDHAFGPERNAKTVYRLRDGVAPIADLCFVLRRGEALMATIRFWPIDIHGPGGAAVPALLLGPIAVKPEERGRGYGVALMEYSLAEARQQGHRIVILVGDAGYYAKFGFTPAVADQLALPGPVDRARFLGLELQPGALDNVAGVVGKARCLRAA
jgi:predicted N-acetyltransferase YhbS